MAQFIQNDKTFTADEDVTKYKLAAIKPGSTSTPLGVQLCEPHQNPIGTFYSEKSSGSVVTVRMFNHYATFEMTAGAAISKGAKVYPGPSGFIYPYGVQGAIGIAQQAATASGDVIEVLYAPIAVEDDEDVQFFRYDFSHYIDADQWTAVNDDGGSVAVGDGYPAAMAITATLTNNDQTWAVSTIEMAQFTALKPIRFKAVVRLTETNVDDANIFVGLANAITNDHLQDDGAGPPASYSGMLFFKVDGGTVWQAEVSDAAEQDTDTNAGAFTSGAWHTLEAWWWPTSSTLFNAEFMVDGTVGAALLADGGTNGLTDYASATDMEFGLGVKCGSGVAEVLYARLVEVAQYVG